MNTYKGDKRAPMYETDIDSIIKHGGYYDINGQWNSIITLKGYPEKIFRKRVEVFIFDDSNKVYINIDPRLGTYRLPGGSCDKDVSDIDQVYIESKEEAKLLIKDIKETGVTYLRLFSDDEKNKRSVIKWDGVYNIVYTANLDKKYYGSIDDVVADKNMIKYGKFYDIQDIYGMLNEAHKKIFKKFTLEGFELGNDLKTENDFINATRFAMDKINEFLFEKEYEYYTLKEIRKESNDKLSIGYYDKTFISKDHIIIFENRINNILDNNDRHNIIFIYCKDGVIYSRLKWNFTKI